MPRRSQAARSSLVQSALLSCTKEGKIYAAAGRVPEPVEDLLLVVVVDGVLCALFGILGHEGCLLFVGCGFFGCGFLGWCFLLLLGVFGGDGGLGCEF